jgi:hypothetical protein
MIICRMARKAVRLRCPFGDQARAVDSSRHYHGGSGLRSPYRFGSQGTCAAGQVRLTHRMRLTVRHLCAMAGPRSPRSGNQWIEIRHSATVRSARLDAASTRKAPANTTVTSAHLAFDLTALGLSAGRGARGPREAEGADYAISTFATISWYSCRCYCSRGLEASSMTRPCELLHSGRRGRWMAARLMRSAHY